MDCFNKSIRDAGTVTSLKSNGPGRNAHNLHQLYDKLK